MANLLPSVEKKRIRREYKIRIGVVSTFLFAGAIAIAVVLLAPSYILSSFKQRNAASQLELEKKKISDATDGIDPIKVAKEVNARLAVLGGNAFRIPAPYKVFTTIVGHKPETLEIKAIFFDRENEEGKITVNGVAKDRETLLVFLQSLEREPMFARVELPISSFVEGEDIKFSILIAIDGKRKDKATSQ